MAWDGSKYHIAEVQEVRFTSRDKMLQNMIRGELDYLPHCFRGRLMPSKRLVSFIHKAILYSNDACDRV